ncbi:hypothetical protein RIR_jg6884.t1 [Rhizophagus irregularis DAOM 181602=DAOM 197198]|nr:hypothetical protein RIR_jg6884.t1 [Rhizophagus irregularis DAOM 181602=DAOM 197198]
MPLFDSSQQDDLVMIGEYEVKVIEKCTFLDPRHEKIRVNRSIVNIERVQELIIGGAEEFFGYKSPKIILKLMEK